MMNQELDSPRLASRLLRGGCRVALLVGLLLAVSCASQDFAGTAENSYRGGESQEELEESIGDRHLAGQLAMEGVLTERRSDRLFVQFQLKNMTRWNLAIEWTIVWVDDRGFQIDAARHWSPLTLGGNGSEALSRTAPTPEAVGFTLGLRKPNAVQ